jgi:hypothetical protein
MKKIFSFFFICIILSLIITDNSNSAIGNTSIAKWKDNKAGAFSMGFDDALASQVDYCIPNFIKRGLVGSFWVNPATTRYGYGINTWEGLVSRTGMELCPHSMNHSGAIFLDQADYEIGESVRIVWELNPPGKSKLLLFLGGGGAIYPDGFRDIVKKYPVVSSRGGGIPYRGRSGGEDLVTFAKEAIEKGEWHSISSHGTGPYAEYLSFNYKYFEALLDYLASVKDKLWVGTCGDVHKYSQELGTANVSVIEASNALIRLELTSEKDPELYDYPLTLVTEVPKDWKYCHITQGVLHDIQPVKSGMVQYEAVPKRGEIILKNSKMDVTPPSIPVVRDGEGDDINSTTYTNKLSANWDSAKDSESGIKRYWYKIGTTPGGSDVLDWIDNGLSTNVTVTRTNLALTRGEKYYFTVKALNGVGLSSEGNSDGHVVEKTPNYIAFNEDFESGNLDKWNKITQSDINTVKVSKDAAHSGNYGIECKLDREENASISKQEIPNIDDAFVRFYFKLSPDFKLPESGKVQLLRLQADPAGINIAIVYLGYDKKAGAYVYAEFEDNTRRAFEIAPLRRYPYDRAVVFANEWNCVDFRNIVNKGRGGAELWVDGVRKGCLPYRFTNRRYFIFMRMGAFDINTSDVAGKIYFDDISVSDSRLKYAK